MQIPNLKRSNSQNSPNSQKMAYLSYPYRSFYYFLLTLLATWLSWFLAIYFSYQAAMLAQVFIFVILGLFAPTIIALKIIHDTNNKEMINDFWDRLNFKGIHLSFFPVIFLLIPFLLFLAITLSTLFGYPLEQFHPAKAFMNIKNYNMTSLSIMIIAPYIAPIGEELGWRAYGVDSLRVRFNLLITSLLFSGIWALWHLPLFFIKGFYENELWNAGLLYVGHFLLNILVLTFLINWVYYKNNRNIMTSIILHFMFNFFLNLFQTEEFTKFIFIMLLFAFMVASIIINPNFFFKK